MMPNSTVLQLERNPEMGAAFDQSTDAAVANVRAGAIRVVSLFRLARVNNRFVMTFRRH